MDTKEVLVFLKEIADQLGPAGQEAFRVVAARVYAESLIWIVTGVILIIASLFISLGCVYGFNHARDYDKGAWILSIFAL